MKYFIVLLIALLILLSGCTSYVLVKNCEQKYQVKSDKYFECEEL